MFTVEDFVYALETLARYYECDRGYEKFQTAMFLERAVGFENAARIVDQKRFDANQEIESLNGCLEGFVFFESSHGAVHTGRTPETATACAAKGRPFLCMAWCTPLGFFEYLEAKRNRCAFIPRQFRRIPV